jgi:hypothetical protein
VRVAVSVAGHAHRGQGLADGRLPLRPRAGHDGRLPVFPGAPENTLDKWFILLHHAFSDDEEIKAKL